MITFKQAITPEQLLDILTDMSHADIVKLAELLGPCQMAIDLINTLTNLQDFKH